MSELQVAKATVLEQFKQALGPNVPTPLQVTIPQMLTRPILNIGVVSHGAFDVIQGIFQPGTTPNWSTDENFPSVYKSMVENMAYGLSVKDHNRIKELEVTNQATLNRLVNTYEQTYSRITDAQLQAANMPTKIDFVVSKIDELKRSFNWPKFAADYGSASADIDIMSNLNSAKVEFARQITAIKQHIQSPGATNGGTEVFDSQNNKVWAAGYNIDPHFAEKFANGQTVKIDIEIEKAGQSGSSFKVNGQAGGTLPAGFFRINGQASADYSDQKFQQLMSRARITLEYSNVCYLAASPSGLDINNTVGWYAPELLRQAFENTAESTGPYFVTNSEAMKTQLKEKRMQAVQGFLVSTAPTGFIEFAEDDFSTFEKIFHAQAHASVDLLGFIPIASADTSYTKTSAGSSDSRFNMRVQLNNTADKNHLVVHGVVLEDPLA